MKSNLSGQPTRVFPDNEAAFALSKLGILSKNDKQSNEEIDEVNELVESPEASDHDTENEEFEYMPIKRGTKKGSDDQNMSDTDEESVVSMSVSSCYTANQMIKIARME